MIIIKQTTQTFPTQTFSPIVYRKAWQLFCYCVPTVIERLWVRVPVKVCEFSFSVTFGGSVWVVCARAVSVRRLMLSISVIDRIDSKTILIKQVDGKCYKFTLWHDSIVRVALVLASYVFEWRPGPVKHDGQWGRCADPPLVCSRSVVFKLLLLLLVPREKYFLWLWHFH